MRIKKGERGLRGLPGVGVPTGGTEGQLLYKTNDTNYRTEWKTILDGLKKITVGTVEPTDPEIGDLWIDTN